jgi:hypothetical protein
MPQGMPQGMPPQQGMPQMAQGQPPMPQGPQGQPPMPQGQPVMAARGGSIDQLMSNLGRHYAGGGIIAFTNGGDVPSSGEFGGFDNAGTFDLLAERVREETRKKAEQELNEKIKFLEMAAPEVAERVKRENAANPQGSKRAEAGVGRPAMENDPRLARDFNPTPTGPGAGKATGAAIKNQITGTSPDDIRPSAGGPSAGGPAAPAAALDPNSLRGLIEANIRKELGKDEDAEWRKGSKRYEDFVGLDKLLQPREARIAEREAMLKKIQGERTPAWVEALSAAGRPVRGGLGTLLSQMGGAAESTRKGYSAEDLKFFDEIGAMRDEVAKLKLEGKYKAAAAGESAIKDAIANKRQAEQSGTSLLNTDEQTATRREIARATAAAKASAGAAGADSKNMANAINAVKNDEVINRLQKRAEELSKMPTSANRAAADAIMKQIEARQNAIYQQFGVLSGLSTMATAPGAASPGGTRPPLSSFQR